MSENTKKENLEYLKEYEIWVGYYHLGQGHDGSKNPEKLAIVKAPDFKTACYIYELQSSLSNINTLIQKKENILETDLSWWWDRSVNSNSWLGKYFETSEEAWETFPRQLKDEYMDKLNNKQNEE